MSLKRRKLFSCFCRKLFLFKVGCISQSLSRLRYRSLVKFHLVLSPNDGINPTNPLSLTDSVASVGHCWIHGPELRNIVKTVHSKREDVVP